MEWEVELRVLGLLIEVGGVGDFEKFWVIVDILFFGLFYFGLFRLRFVIYRFFFGIFGFAWVS